LRRLRASYPLGDLADEMRVDTANPLRPEEETQRPQIIEIESSVDLGTGDGGILPSGEGHQGPAGLLYEHMGTLGLTELLHE
jgi:hypothetical protein